MISGQNLSRLRVPGLAAVVWLLAALVISTTCADERQTEVLHVGTSGSLLSPDDSGTERGAVDALESLLKDETGFEIKTHRQNTWRKLADKITKGELGLGIFRGYEFAWASESHRHLKPLLALVNGHRYSVVSVVTRKDNPAKDFAGLQDQSLSIPNTGQRDLRFFIDRSCRANGKGPEKFFSKISSPHNVVNALDDVVDGQVQVTVVDQAVLNAYKQLKPGRFERLKVVARSQPLPPTVIAYDERTLDQAAARRIREGLTGTAAKEKHQMTLALFHWTGFEQIPADFDQALAKTRQAYPPPPTPTR
jgi:ABC-type phosphate/phosphonate transport system substrate-binding protein